MDSIKKHWLLTLIILVVVAGVIFFFSKKNDTVEVTTVPATDSTTLSKYIPDITITDAKDISKAIDKAQTSTPTYIYYTTTQTVADKTAQAFAKEQKADKLIKTTEETKVTEETTAKTDGDKSVTLNPGDSLIENKYYAINLEKKHEIKVGAAAINHKGYAVVAYRNRDLTYTALYSPAHKDAGFMISYTVAKW